MINDSVQKTRGDLSVRAKSSISSKSVLPYNVQTETQGKGNVKDNVFSPTNVARNIGFTKEDLHKFVFADMKAKDE